MTPPRAVPNLTCEPATFSLYTGSLPALAERAPNVCARPRRLVAWTDRCGDAMHPADAKQQSVAGAKMACAAARLKDEPQPHRRSTARERADQGLLEGRLAILSVTDTKVEAVWRGEGYLYRYGWTVGHWHCPCEARTDACHHLLALKRVVAVRPGVER